LKCKKCDGNICESFQITAKQAYHMSYSCEKCEFVNADVEFVCIHEHLVDDCVVCWIRRIFLQGPTNLSTDEELV